MNLDELDTLLHEAPTPAMSIDPDHVVRGGRTRVHRRRTAIGGGVLAGALLVGTAGLMSLRTGSNEPVPAGPNTTASRSTPKLSSYYDMTDGTKKPGQISFQTPIVGAGAPVAITLKVTKVNGALRLSRVKGAVTADLPTVQSLPGGMIVTQIENTTVAVLPTPGDIDRASMTGTFNAKDGLVTSDFGLVLTDGTPVTVFSTSSPTQVSGAYWTHGSAVVASDGQSVTPTRVNSKYSAFVLPGIGVRGVRKGDGTISTAALTTTPPQAVSTPPEMAFGQPGGEAFWSRWFTSRPSAVQFEWKGVRGATPAIDVVRVGNSNWWVAGAVSDGDMSQVSVTKVTWTDATGTHTR